MGPGRRRPFEYRLGREVVGKGPRLAGRGVEAVAEDGGERVEERGTDGLVVASPYPVAGVPGSQGAGVAEKGRRGRACLHDLGELLGEPDLLQLQVGAEQRVSAASSGLKLPCLFIYAHRVRDLSYGTAGLVVATIALASLARNPAGRAAADPWTPPRGPRAGPGVAPAGPPPPSPAPPPP